MYIQAVSQKAATFLKFASVVNQLSKISHFVALYYRFRTGLLFAEGGSFFGLVLWMVSRACPPQLKGGYSEMEFDWFCFAATN